MISKQFFRASLFEYFLPKTHFKYTFYISLISKKQQNNKQLKKLEFPVISDLHLTDRFLAFERRVGTCLNIEVIVYTHTSFN